jgi:hydrogenase-4 component E
VERAVDPLLVMVLLLNFFVLGTSRMRSVIQGAAAQGALLAAVALVAHGDFGWRALVMALGAALLKAFFIPATLLRAMRDVAIRHEVEPYVGFTASLLIGAIGTGLAIVFARTLPLTPEHADSLLIPAALATVLTGFVVLITRKKAITQVVGYLVLENGIFIMGVALVDAMPFLVEMGVLLDLLVGIFVMGIIINHIQREFSSVDTDRLSQLKE